MSTPAAIDPALLDEDGLLRDFNAWDEALARDSGLGALTEAHWKVIRAMRENFARFGAAPAMHRVCRDAGVQRREVNDLFGYCLVAWRVAGLRRGGEVLSRQHVALRPRGARDARRPPAPRTT